MPVVIVVTRAHALSPARTSQPGFYRDIGKRAIPVVFVKAADGLRSFGVRCLESCAVHEEDVQPAIIVIIEKRDAAAGCLQQISIARLRAKNRLGVEASLPGHVDELHWQGRSL